MAEKIELQIVADNADYIQKTKQVEDATKSMQRSVQEGDKRQKGLIEDQIAALKELEKIEMIRQTDGNYRLHHAVTANQKEILKAFDLTERNIREQALGINQKLQMIV